MLSLARRCATTRLVWDDAAFHSLDAMTSIANGTFSLGLAKSSVCPPPDLWREFLSSLGSRPGRVFTHLRVNRTSNAVAPPLSVPFPGRVAVSSGGVEKGLGTGG
jgi:hypothetical protein